jgi:predicted N-acetyltransferase YhbS
VLVARAGEQLLGHLQLVPAEPPNIVEIKNMAVAETHQGQGIGRMLVAAALDRARDDGMSTVLVATATADIGNLRFYQRVGFRMLSIERDAFTPATGYPDGLLIDGIELRDRVWLSRSVSSSTSYSPPKRRGGSGQETPGAACSQVGAR